MSVGERMKNRRKELGLSADDIAEKIGVSRSTVFRYEKGEIEKLPIEILYPLSEALKTTPEFLMGLKHTAPTSNMMPVTGFQRIPVLGKIACGDPITAIENISEYREVPKDYLNYNGELFFLEASGDSMEPKIPDGSYVLCREQEDVESGEIAAVLVNGDEETTLKKVIKQGNTILLQPLNEEYAPYIVTEDNPAKIVGKALRVDTEL